MSEEQRLEARLRALGAVPDAGADWENVLRRAGERFSPRRFDRRRLALALVAAVVVAASFVALLSVGGTHPRQTGSMGATGTGGATGMKGATGPVGATGISHGPTAYGPVLMNANELKAKALTLGSAIYWAGPVDGDNYELTRTRRGHLFLRYLPHGVKAASQPGGFLIVATYPYPGAYDVLTHRAGGGIVSGPDGGVIDPNDPNANDPKDYRLAFPGVDYEIEIYDPKPGKALAIAKSGDIRPVG